MIVMRRLISSALLAMSAAMPFAAAQQPRAGSLQALLPTGAEIIETADLTAIARKPRTIVLWMLYPQRNLDDKANKNQEGGYCSDIIHGDFGKFWRGPTRLSLIDLREMKLINTIEVHEGCDTCDDSFRIPLCVRNSNSGRGGRPNLDLRDLTGEGLNADFTLLTFEAYGLASTGAFGYEARFDRVVQYPVEIGADKPTLWTDMVFAKEALRPGHWSFTSAPGHGDPATYVEEVSFDRVRRVFVQEIARIPP
jgi:hypothetical protein